ncbi:MAG: hypothetical protein ACRDVE_20580, partial [Actinocrinis sp.]
LAARLPAGERNGLDALGAQVATHPTGRFVLVVLVDVSETKTKLDVGLSTATLRIRRIEALTGKDGDTARKLLLAAMKRRTGRDQLTLDDLLAEDAEGHAHGDDGP